MYIVSLIRYVITTIHYESNNVEELVSSASNLISLLKRQTPLAESYFMNEINLIESKLNKMIQNSSNISFKTEIKNVEGYIHFYINNPFKGLSTRVLKKTRSYKMLELDKFLINMVSDTYFFNLNKILTLNYYIKPNSFVKMIDFESDNKLYYIDKKLNNPFIRFEMFYYFIPYNFIINESAPNNQILSVSSEEIFVKYFNLFENYLEKFNNCFEVLVADNHDYFKNYTIIEEFPNLFEGKHFKAKRLIDRLMVKSEFYLLKLIPEINWMYQKSFLYKSNCFLRIKMHSIFSLLVLKSLFDINTFYEIFVSKDHSTDIILRIEILRYRTILFLFYYNDPLFLGISNNQIALLFFSFLDFYNPYLLTCDLAIFILHNFFCKYFNDFLKRRRSYLLNTKYEFYVQSYFQKTGKEGITLEFLETFFDNTSKNSAIDMYLIIFTYFNNFINLKSDASFIDYIKKMHEYLNKEN